MRIKKDNVYVSFDDICNFISNEIYHSSPRSVKKYLKALFKVILRQLELHKKIYLKDFGTFEIRERKSGERMMYNPNKQRSEVVYVKPRYVITFRPSSKFDYMINENDFKMLHGNSKIEHNKTDKKLNNTSKLINRANMRKEKLNEKYLF